eukprot:TRINITY_DN3227_c0_g1_i2.p3 TRINITY_DN3227_c0_g1~~TRINITY_DN3227_c0_g1_i2.p3  ORF type:complete len:272 (+),score=50.12 TRINITY_DN3227_c0_g1_i2:68-817(+)
MRSGRPRLVLLSGARARTGRRGAAQSTAFFEHTDGVFAAVAAAADPVAWTAGGMLALHSGGLPWWAVAAATGAGLRLCATPCVLWALRNDTRMRAHTPELLRLRRELLAVDKDERTRGDTRRRLLARSSIVAELAALRRSGGFSEWGGLWAAAALLPLGVAHLATWRLAAAGEIAEGALWVPCLASPDPTYVLPVAAATALLFSAAASTHAGQGGAAGAAAALGAGALCAAALAQLPAAVAIAVQGRAL